MKWAALLVCALAIGCGDSEDGSSASSTSSSGGGAGGNMMAGDALCDMTDCAAATLPNTPGCPMTVPTEGGACISTKGCNYCDGAGNYTTFVCDSRDVWSVTTPTAACN